MSRPAGADQDAIAELASNEEYFTCIDEASQLAAVFSQFALRLQAIAESNAVVTPRVGPSRERARRRLSYAGAGEVPAEEAAAVETGRLVLDTQPHAAEVFIDHERIGKTPELRTIDLPAGIHQLRVVHPKRQPYLEKVEIVAGKNLKRRIKLRALR